MISRHPRFKHHFSWQILPEEGVLLFSEQGDFLLRGAAYSRIAPYLNGEYSEEAIVAALRDQQSAAETFFILEILRRKGYLVDARTDLSVEQAAFWELLNIEPAAAVERLQTAALRLHCFGQIGLQPLQQLLTDSGVRLSHSGDHWLALADDYLRPELADLNRQALAEGRSWLLIRPLGPTVWLGPLFVPGQTGCWACLAQRLRGHRKLEAYWQQQSGQTAGLNRVSASLPSINQSAVSLAVTEIVRWLVEGQSESLLGTCLTLDLHTLTKTTHHLTRRPQCPVCGRPEQFRQQQYTPLQLMPQPKRFTTDGGHRGQTPAETLRRYRRHLSPITGIVSELQPVSFGAAAGFVHAYVTDHNFALDYRDLDLVREGLRGRAGGKGKSDQQARASALCESLERYSGVFQGDEARLTARFDDLAGAAIHPNACMNFSQRQYETRIELNARPSRFNRVPEPFDESREIEWSPVWSLTHQVWRYLPTAYCYYGYDQHQSAPYARADANGCAAGNSLEEAILQGFLELVERDSVALWWYNRLPVPGVDLTSFDEPYFSQLVDYYGSQQRALWVLDITADFGIPTFAAVTGRIDQAAEDLLFAFGAHFDPQLALLRALTELNQMLPALFDGTPTGPNWDQDALAWWQTATLENQPYLVPASAQKVRTKEDYAMPVSDDLYTDVQHCIELVKSKGMELLVLDQTRPDVGLPVVKVIVPGMRHFWARFGPGRLYDVPVRLGRLPQPYTEDELNPHWMFL